MPSRAGRRQAETPIAPLFGQIHARQSHKARCIHPVSRAAIIRRQIKAMQRGAAACFKIRLVPHGAYFGPVAVQRNPPAGGLQFAFWQNGRRFPPTSWQLFAIGVKIVGI